APKEIKFAGTLPAAAEPRASALSRRPDLQALINRLRADEAALALARKEFYPDFEPFAMYDRFMGNNAQSQDLATMIGVKVNLPVRTTRRQGALAEAQARIGQRRADLDRRADAIQFEVQQAYEQVRRKEKTVKLYEESILPAAEKNREAARAAFVGGR